MPDKFAYLVDRERSVNEIALVNTTSGKVYYGVESLLRIMVHSFSFLKPVVQNKAFLKIADKLYKFISFNRRVIVSAKKGEAQNPALNPSFHRGYRIAYLVFTCLFTVVILHPFSLRLGDSLPASSLLRESLVCGGQLLWQGLIARKLAREKAWDYLGNLMTVSLGGSLVLAVVMGLGELASWSHPLFYLLDFGITVGLMLLEHIRRTRILGLSSVLTVSWILYRILVLIILTTIYYVK